MYGNGVIYPMCNKTDYSIKRKPMSAVVLSILDLPGARTRYQTQPTKYALGLFFFAPTLKFKPDKHEVWRHELYLHF